MEGVSAMLSLNFPNAVTVVVRVRQAQYARVNNLAGQSRSIRDMTAAAS